MTTSVAPFIPNPIMPPQCTSNRTPVARTTPPLATKHATHYTFACTFDRAHLAKPLQRHWAEFMAHTSFGRRFVSIVAALPCSV
jgi:hypothetical protein